MYNLPGLPNNLHITGPIIADIYLGKIKNWNDPKIKAVNRGVNLPSTDITPVYRSDSSGTTYNFTTYLNTVSKQWKSRSAAARPSTGRRVSAHAAAPASRA